MPVNISPFMEMPSVPYSYRPKRMLHVKDAGALLRNCGAQIKVNGKLFGTYPLSGDGEIDVDGLLTVVIRDGQVSVTGSNCRNHLCEKHSPVSLSGSTIVCLPQGVVIRITGDGEVDALI